jgi:hypothetical protein
VLHSKEAGLSTVRAKTSPDRVEAKQTA